ncbi:DUF6364 family protein [Niabella drilacis]|uniref:Antitoxin n=1 Tax=Niabella drilacis (strain DSM 25811 / CCM 8410 / CCUG 62505 / LMG 26954 / E90) TaxID=1285928 RepID=A0A1G7BT70_NIADE|nr:DUF6364 family protein [Niabella drilacis]SDE29395.1 hypothetical protein SAMN04487894_13217 [Niabella drilacis]
MNAKLTLNLNKAVIDNAKDYAKEQHTSLSKLIENYLGSLTKKDSTKAKISPLVERLTGIIPGEQKTEDYKSDYHEYLTKKYS